MKDNGPWKGFFRYRSADGERSYGDCIDQICFVPFEADVLSPDDPFIRQISDWWTEPGATARFGMTYSTDGQDWRSWGTRWHYYFSGSPLNDRLYPGPGFQLAKVEWKYGVSTGDQTLMQRALGRLTFGFQAGQASLWFGADGRSEAGVPNGIVDWRNQVLYFRSAQGRERFIDTSSYFIQVCSMIYFHTDTKLTVIERRAASRRIDKIKKPLEVCRDHAL